MSKTKPSFTFFLHWPDDASRVAPLPGGSRVCITATQPFAAHYEVQHMQAAADGEVWKAWIELPKVKAVQPSSILLRCQHGEHHLPVLLLPEASKVAAEPAMTPPFAGAHGILANKLGASVQARAAWSPINSKYDAFLAANLDPAGPGDRRVVLPWIEVQCIFAHERITLDAATAVSFASEGRTLRWQHRVHGLDLHILLTLGEGNAIQVTWEMPSCTADDLVVLVRPMLEDRSFHNVTKAFTGPEHELPARVSAQENGFRFSLAGGHELLIQADTVFRPEPQWRYCIGLAVENARGLEDMTDAFSPGAFIWKPARQPLLQLGASIGGAAIPAPNKHLHPTTLPEAIEQSLDLYFADRSGELTVIAGYPWFLDWGRDSLIFARGLIASGRLKEAASIIRRFASFEQDGTLPNLLRGSEVTNRESSDAPLWLVVAMGELLAAKGKITGDCGGRTLREVAQSIIEARQRTLMDAHSGLIYSAPHHTWMDTDNPACTPREGYPIDIQALWCRALRVVADLQKNADLHVLADRVAGSIESLFWREDLGFFSDCLHAKPGIPASQAVADDHLRPNQWLAITLGAVTDKDKARRALEASQCLLVPGAARSLATRPVSHALPIGLGVDPHHPYQPRYTGPEDQTRKPAYHNGTAWCWPYPHFAEALFEVFGKPQRAAARQLMSASALPWQAGCVAQLPEILDGSLPHVQRGCGAQAWSISEWVRVWHKLGA